MLAVLAGVFAMHALAPGPTVAVAGPGVMHHGAVAGSVPAAHRASMPGPHGKALPEGESCHPAAGGGMGGHLHHADSTCTAAGTATGYAPPAPAPAGITALDAGLPPAPAGAAGAVSRAPPDLAQLQLLRI